MKLALPVLATLALAPTSHATEVTVETLSFDAVADPPRVVARVSWSNAWRDATHHDAAWLFVKLRGGPMDRDAHAFLGDGGHRVSATSDGGPSGEWVLPEDRIGVFVQLAQEHRGDVAWTVELTLEPASVAGLRGWVGEAPLTAEVHAIEMVRVPDGPFWIGDPDPSMAEEFGAFFRSGPRGANDGPYRVEDEGPIRVGPRPGQLWYDVPFAPQYMGDRRGPVPAAFPKGTRAFYAMKYELAQGEYAAFLDSIATTGAGRRFCGGAPDYAELRGTIALVDGSYVAASPRRPCNFASWDDGCAFADWAGLRPMTELEYAKACRGAREPVAHERPWGTADADELERVVGPDGDLLLASAAEEAALDATTRARFGASEYGILDLAGSTWERVVTIGHPRGRSFEGTHGDGQVTTYSSDATNADWPRGDDEEAGEDHGGYGYRGGGFYDPEHPMNEWGPQHPVAMRPFGSWGSAPRYKAYGFRAVRTAPR